MQFIDSSLPLSIFERYYCTYRFWICILLRLCTIITSRLDYTGGQMKPHRQFSAKCFDLLQRNHARFWSKWWLIWKPWYITSKIKNEIECSTIREVATPTWMNGILFNYFVGKTMTQSISFSKIRFTSLLAETFSVSFCFILHIFSFNHTRLFSNFVKNFFILLSKRARCLGNNYANKKFWMILF